MDRLIAVGDIHGHLDKLNRLLEHVVPTNADRLVFLGDYMDRGPESRGVIERLIALREAFPRTVFLRGNHEQLLLDAMVELGLSSDTPLRERSPHYAEYSYPSDWAIFIANGGTATLRSYGINSLVEGLPEEHLDFIRGTEIWWEHAPFIFVHAGADPDAAMEHQRIDRLLWERNALPGKNGHIYVVGHSPTPDQLPHFEPGLYALDTGAGHGHRLTACNVLNRHYWQVE